MEQEKLTLYRGDTVPIKRFTLQKVNKINSLVGPGIYLTDLLHVADTYRRKEIGNGNSRHHASRIVLHTSPKITINTQERITGDRYGDTTDIRHPSNKALLAKGQEAYFKLRWQQETNSAPLPEKHTKEWTDFVKVEKYQWKQYIKTEAISIYHNRYRSLDRNDRSRLKSTAQLDSSVILRFKSGFVSVFEFDKESFEKQMLDLNGPIKDLRVVKLLYNMDFFIKFKKLQRNVSSPLYFNRLTGLEGFVHKPSFSEYRERLKFVRISVGCNSAELNKDVKLFHDKHPDFPCLPCRLDIEQEGIKYPEFIAALKSLGYKGFEYSGGSFTMSETKHRAFSIWDENLINTSLIEQYK